MVTTQPCDSPLAYSFTGLRPYALKQPNESFGRRDTKRDKSYKNPGRLYKNRKGHSDPSRRFYGPRPPSNPEHDKSHSQSRKCGKEWVDQSPIGVYFAV